MARQGVKRRLAAILSADVASYSHLMIEDEAGTFEALKAHRAELIDPEVAKRGGVALYLLLLLLHGPVIGLSALPA